MANTANMRGEQLPLLYLILDEPSLPGQDMRSVLREAITGGVAVVQYRSKDATTRHMVAVAEQIVRVTRRHKVPLIVNDRADVALAVGAEGLHVGADDMPPELARRLLGPAATVGVTVRNAAEARQAVSRGASYVAVGAVFASPTKPDAPVVGLDQVTEVKDAVDIPVCAIGGITPDNAAEVIAAGADLVCVASAITQADRPRGAAAALAAAIEEAAGTDL